MDDREKILVWLNCYCPGNDNPDCGKCPFQYGDCAVELPKAIKNLLQEPIALIPAEKVESLHWEIVKIYCCGNCGLEFNHYGWKYCPYCGRKAKLDE